MENLKNLYRNYSNSDEYMRFEEMPEVADEKIKVHDFFRQHFTNDDFFTSVRLATSYAYAHEMRGFVLGFGCAMRIAAECFVGQTKRRNGGETE